MTPPGNILPPPEGLDIGEIATEAGLLGAIERESKRLKVADGKGHRVSRDQIRLISFLAGEVRRRVDGLSPEQKEELEDIRVKARQRASEHSIREVIKDIHGFAEEASRPHAAVSFSLVSELEIRVRGVRGSVDPQSENYAKLVERLKEAVEELNEVKKRGITGFKEFK